MIMATANSRVARHRQSLRDRGLRPIQLWVPDTRLPGFAEECRRQSRIINEGESGTDILDFLDDSIDDIDGWEA